MFKLDLSDFERVARNIQAKADQVPYALSRSLNDAARATYTKLTTDTWPSHVTVRNGGFIKWALRTKFSTKSDLNVEINDAKSQGRGHLALHDKGGTKPARGLLAIPTGNVRRGASGVVKSQRPTALRAAGKSFVKNGVVYVRAGTKKKPTIKPMFELKSSAKMKSDVPFASDFETTMKREVQTAFQRRIAEAMATRK